MSQFPKQSSAGVQVFSGVLCQSLCVDGCTRCLVASVLLGPAVWCMELYGVVLW